MSIVDGYTTIIHFSSASQQFYFISSLSWHVRYLLYRTYQVLHTIETAILTDDHVKLDQIKLNQIKSIYLDQVKLFQIETYPLFKITLKYERKSNFFMKFLTLYSFPLFIVA